MITVEYKKEYNLGYVFSDKLIESKLFKSLKEDVNHGLSDICYEAVVSSVPDLKEVIVDYYSSVNEEEDLIMEFTEDSIFLDIPIVFVFIVNEYKEEVLGLKGKRLGDGSHKNNIKVFNLVVSHMDDYKDSVRGDITGRLLIKVKIMDKISESFTSKANSGLKQFGV